MDQHQPLFADMDVGMDRDLYFPAKEISHETVPSFESVCRRRRSGQMRSRSDENRADAIQPVAQSVIQRQNMSRHGQIQTEAVQRQYESLAQWPCHCYR